ncbi:MAG: hypothetical protein IH795_03665 [Bacteroidetes bacterium]|nr:hypothetical protein [Bacteroidota bacterium]
MALKFKIKHNYFQDALRLMRISKNAREIDGVKKAVAVMATDKAKYAIEDADLMTKQIKDATAGDLVIAVEADTDEFAARSETRVDGHDALLAAGPRRLNASAISPASTRTAC